MKKKPVVAARGDISVFLPDRVRTDAHIIDVLIEERCPSFANHWAWPVLRPALYSLLGYATARRMTDEMQGMSGPDSFDYLARELQFKLQMQRFERLPKTGRVVVVANHPTGLADGAAIWDALTRVRRDVVIFANADAVRLNPRFEEAIIPVEWVLDKRSPSKTRETLRRAGQAFAEEKCVFIFPSGKLAKMVDNRLTEQEWFPTAVSLARKQKAPILPLHIGARNSSLYYLFSRLNGELRDITLFRELLNKYRSRFDMVAGPLIDSTELAGDPVEITERLQNYVSYGLSPETPDIPFL